MSDQLRHRLPTTTPDEANRLVAACAHGLAGAVADADLVDLLELLAVAAEVEVAVLLPVDEDAHPVGVGGSDLAALRPLARSAADHDQPVRGTGRWAQVSAVDVRDRDGTVHGTLCLVGRTPPADPERLAALLHRGAIQVERHLARLRFAEDRERAQTRLEADARITDTVLDGVVDALAVCDADGHLIRWNAAMETLFARDDFASVPPARWARAYGLHEADGVTPLTTERMPLVRALRGEQLVDEDLVHRPSDGGPVRILSFHGQRMVDRLGRTLGAVVTLRDVTTIRHAEERLRRRAETDHLTDLPGRIALRRDLDRRLSGRTPERTGLVFLDLDGFKAVNDQLGHAAGDTVLRAVADRLQQTVDASDVVARLSGDEFVVLACRERQEELDALAAACVTRVEQPLTVAGKPLRVGASAGVAHAGAIGTRSGAELLRIADASMYLDKTTRAVERASQAS